MRIRKNKKLLPSTIYGEASRRESVHVCQLNQSPWDVIPFAQDPYPSSFHHQFEAEDSFNGNGSLGDSVGAVESVASMMESEEKPIMKVEDMVINDNDDMDETIIGLQFGFKSQCEAEEKESKQDVLLKSRNNNDNPSSLTIKKSEKNNNTSTTGSRRGRARAAKKGSSAAANPYEFYYYSGFGPSWGKRRGGGGGGSCSDRAGETSKDIEAKDVENNSSAITTQHNTTPSSSSQIDNNEEFDYVDDEEDDEDDEDGDSGKKRMRKPVKARSLKSLM